MKTTILKFFTLSAAIFAFSNISFGQNTASAEADAGARIITPLTIENNQGLEFGDIIAGANKITITTAGARSATNEDAFLVTTGVTRTPQAAQFTVNGEANLSYTLVIDPSATLTQVDGTATMTINNFGHNATGTLSGSGAEVFNVGADLIVGASQASGVYEGTFEVTVTYE